MSAHTLTPIGFRAGIWRGRITGGAVGMIEVLHEGEALTSVDVVKDGDGWLVTAAIPSETLGEGVSTYLVRDRDSGHDLGGFEISVGPGDDGDLRAEVRLLRAELDLLKKAFRRLVAGD